MKIPNLPGIVSRFLGRRVCDSEDIFRDLLNLIHLTIGKVDDLPMAKGIFQIKPKLCAIGCRPTPTAFGKGPAIFGEFYDLEAIRGC